MRCPAPDDAVVVVCAEYTSTPHEQAVALVVLFPLALLVGATLGSWLAGKLVHRDATRRKLHHTNLRIRGWWIIYVVVTGSWLLGDTALVVLFGIVSFLALREYMTIAPTGRGDHRALAWAFFVVLPVQYILVGRGLVGAFGFFIPVACFLFLSLRAALAGDVDRFLERVAMVQWGLMACVYCVSHVPALLALDLRRGDEALLLLWMVLVVQLGDAFQNLVGTFLGRHRLPWDASGQASWEGMFAGFATAGITGAVLAGATPFSVPVAAGMGVGLAVLGGSGRLVMGAVKRSRGVRLAGVLIEGHGGVLDRVDSLLFAAPVFFYVVRTWYT